MILRGRLDALAGSHRQAVKTWMGLCDDHPEMLHEVAGLVQVFAEVMQLVDKRLASRQTSRT